MAGKIRDDIEGVVLVGNDKGESVVLSAGDPVPAGFVAGDHVLEEKKSTRSSGDK